MSILHFHRILPLSSTWDLARPYSYIPSRFDLVYMNKDGQKDLKSAGKLSRDYVHFL